MKLRVALGALLSFLLFLGCLTYLVDHGVRTGFDAVILVMAIVSGLPPFTIGLRLVRSDLLCHDRPYQPVEEGVNIEDGGDETLQESIRRLTPAILALTLAITANTQVNQTMTDGEEGKTTGQHL